MALYNSAFLVSNTIMEKHTTRTQIRLPEDLYEELKTSAEKRGRSLNAEMIDRIKYSFYYNIDERPLSFDDSIVAALLEVQKEIAVLKEKLK